jgi:glycosyltransferase involved in cell wall biosynthesis
MSVAENGTAAVTALMPLRHGHLEYVRRALRSMLEQSCPHWRLQIVVERAELATLSGVLEEFLRDARIQLRRNEGRRLAGALNTGMRHASTEFVGILLADDMWAPDAVAVLTERIGAFPHVDFFHSSRIFIDECDNVISSIHLSKPRFVLEDFFQASPVKHLLCWRRRTALSCGGMDERLNYVGPDDYDFPWTMAERGAVFMAVPEPLYRYRDHRTGRRLTTHVPLSVHRREIRRILSKHGAPHEAIERMLAHATASYLRQCLYRTTWDKWIKELLGWSIRSPWRETYE